MQDLFFITSLGFILWIIRNTLFWVELWQSKEYRLDRLSVHLRETLQGNHLFFSPLSIIKWVLLLLYGIGFLTHRIPALYTIGVEILYLIEGTFVCLELWNGYKLRRPVRTLKAIAITLLSVCSLLLLYSLLHTNIYIKFLLLDRMLIVLIAVFVFLFAFPTKIYIAMKIKKAKEHCKAMKKLLIIAISGSYGKSSTKEFIAQVLEQKYTVVKTHGSNNTPIGIANTMLAHITEKTDVFVVEMGAYKKGEVTQLCEIVPPNMSVTTSISDQHLSLFGSVTNAIATEQELLTALPKDGLALFNGNSENNYPLYTTTKKKKILYKVVAKEEKNLPIQAMHVVQEKDGVRFTVLLEKKKIEFTAPILGVHMVENILPAIFIGNYLGIPVSLIQQAVAHLAPPPKTMTKKVLSTGVILIDDTFNASPESVQSAMEYLSIYQTKKLFVLMPLVELGKHAKKRHYDIGVQAAKVCDYLFVTNKNFYEEIRQGVTDGGTHCQLLYKNIPALVTEISALAQKDDVIIFEGKEAGKVLQGLL